MELELSEWHEEVACTMCGCVCDDLKVRTENGHVLELVNACELSEPWLSQQSSAGMQPVVLKGEPRELEAGIQAAVELLNDSTAPLIYGLSRSATPGQRAAVRLADRLGATIDTSASTCHAPSIMALQRVGESTSSLGEARNRSDLVIYWGSNPVKSHPRHMERLVDSPGLFVPDGRSGRHVVVVDVERTETAELADSFVQVERGQDFELLWVLRALVKGRPIDPQSQVAGVAWEQIEQLAERMKSCRYGVIFFGIGITHGSIPHITIEALLQLVTDLHRYTRFTARRMRVHGDVAGADSVLCWQTGYPFSVNLAQGYPRYNPGEYTAINLLERREVDAAVFVGTDGLDKFTPEAFEAIREIPTIVLESPLRPVQWEPTLRFRTSIYGIHRFGTAYRMDETPIPLRPFLTSPLPSDEDILSRIGDQIEIRL